MTTARPLGDWKLARGKGRPEAYKLADGTRVPSVTTVTGARKAGIEGLLVWANRLGREGKDHKEERQKAADAGSVAHAMVENHIHGREALEGVLEIKPEILEPARKGFEGFLRWQDMMQLEYLWTETPLVSEQYRFGGTPDALARGKDKLLILPDWKSSNAVYGDYIIQLAAYRVLCEDYQHESIPTCTILRFGKEHGDFHFHSYPEEVMELGWKAFLHLLELYQLDKQLKKVAS